MGIDADTKVVTHASAATTKWFENIHMKKWFDSGEFFYTFYIDNLNNN